MSFKNKNKFRNTALAAAGLASLASLTGCGDKYLDAEYNRDLNRDRRGDYAAVDLNGDGEKDFVFISQDDWGANVTKGRVGDESLRGSDLARRIVNYHGLGRGAEIVVAFGDFTLGDNTQNERDGLVWNEADGDEVLYVIPGKKGYELYAMCEDKRQNAEDGDVYQKPVLIGGFKERPRVKKLEDNRYNSILQGMERLVVESDERR